VTLAEALHELVTLLPELAAAARRPHIEPVAVRKRQAARMVGICPRLLERLRAAGKFPAPDATAGKCPLWTRSTLEAWISAGGTR
jgi:hypothetical protein